MHLQKSIDVVDELSSEMALKLLVEKRFSEKFESVEVVSLIEKVQNVLKDKDETTVKSKIQAAVSYS